MCEEILKAGMLSPQLGHIVNRLELFSLGAPERECAATGLESTPGRGEGVAKLVAGAEGVAEDDDCDDLQDHGAKY